MNAMSVKEFVNFLDGALQAKPEPPTKNACHSRRKPRTAAQIDSILETIDTERGGEGLTRLPNRHSIAHGRPRFATNPLQKPSQDL